MAEKNIIDCLKESFVFIEVDEQSACMMGAVGCSSFGRFVVRPLHRNEIHQAIGKAYGLRIFSLDQGQIPGIHFP